MSDYDWHMSLPFKARQLDAALVEELGCYLRQYVAAEAAALVFADRLQRCRAEEKWCLKQSAPLQLVGERSLNTSHKE